ncbi:Cytochrome P450 [Quillaja saponaria]|uniref:Cytochrome P450 n=1 Tax=Quillaja saponaria TaxID=32244 RepID=A0AAD7LNU8_QUISA|nr:Cytochrome P450 [Quillaja saponaria]
MGVHPTLVVSNHKIVKECLTINDQIFASHPLFNPGKHLGYNNASYGFSSYGAYWRDMRKVTGLEILSAQRVDELKRTIFASEINNMIEDLFLFCKNNGGNSRVDISECIEILQLNVMVKVMIGRGIQLASMTQLKGLIVRGAKTTTTTVIWLLSLLLKNKHTLKLVQEELDLHCCKERKVEYSNINNLVYLQATVKETLLLYLPGPVLVPHLANEDCQVQGYHVPKGTHLIVNAWKMHRDPNVWPEPEKFKLERFLITHKGVDASGKHFVLLPFGFGRRACPGYTFATQLMYLAIARLLQGFDLKTPSNEPIDISETIGISLLRETPLEVCPYSPPFSRVVRLIISLFVFMLLCV